MSTFTSVEPYPCPVCGYGLNKRAVDFIICPSCGVEFGYSDAGTTHHALRGGWIQFGAPWSSFVIPRPKNWNPWTQLIRAVWRSTYRGWLALLLSSVRSSNRLRFLSTALSRTAKRQVLWSHTDEASHIHAMQQRSPRPAVWSFAHFCFSRNRFSGIRRNGTTSERSDSKGVGSLFEVQYGAGRCWQGLHIYLDHSLARRLDIHGGFPSGEAANNRWNGLCK